MKKKETKVISIQSLLTDKDFFVQEALNNKIFIYPTDSIYWIGTLYTPQNLKTINHIKQRNENQICSIIAPSFEWIKSKFPEFSEKQFYYFQEKYKQITIIFDYNFPGVRIIKHPFQEFVKFLQKPFITTSVNTIWTKPIKNFSETPAEILKYVDYFVDSWTLDWHPSVIIDMVSNKIITR